MSGLEGAAIASSISSSESSIFSADLNFPICFVFLGIGCAATFCPDAFACCDRPFRICCLEIASFSLTRLFCTGFCDCVRAAEVADLAVSWPRWVRILSRSIRVDHWLTLVCECLGRAGQSSILKDTPLCHASLQEEVAAT